MAMENRTAAHEVEEGLWRRVLKIGRDGMDMFFALHGDGEEGEQVSLPGVGQLKRLEQPHVRTYVSVFGEFELVRVVYGTREGQKIEYVPLDARLKLPRSKFSYLLQDWDQSLSLEMPFARVDATMEKILGMRQSVHSLERCGRNLSDEVPPFWQAQPVPPAAEEGALLVCSADGKGVPMRQAGEPSPIGAVKPDKGVRAGTKKMALLGSVYTVDPYRRTPEEVFAALFRSANSAPERPPARPRPCFKHVRAALLRDEADTTAPQIDTIFGWMAQQVVARGRHGERPLVLLMDGQESLWNAGLVYLPEEDFQVIEILDLLHAISYVWKAAHLFHPSGSDQAFNLVRKQVMRILSGQVQNVILSLRRMAKRRKLSKKRAEELERTCGYLRSNAHRMAYDKYLAVGYPISSGVIEGACRCVVNDRMERSGMRWVLDGAHAMLSLRSIHLSGLWNDFIHFRIAHESARLYPHSVANDDDFHLPCAA